MSDPPQFFDSARARVAREIHLFREGANPPSTIPPPPFWRLMTLAFLRAGTLIVLFGIAALVVFTVNPGTVFPLAIPCAVLPALILMLLRITRVAFAGSQPTIIRASPLGLQVAPRGMTYLNCNWSAIQLADIGVRECGAFPLFARDIQLQLIFTADRIETHNIPWNGVGALANIEDTLRDVLALPRKSKPD